MRAPGVAESELQNENMDVLLVPDQDSDEKVDPNWFDTGWPLQQQIVWWTGLPWPRSLSQATILAWDASPCTKSSFMAR